MLALLVVCLCFYLGVPVPIDKAHVLGKLTEKNEIVAFYNLFAQGPHFRNIVRDQVASIKGSHLIERLDRVFYATVGADGANFTIEEPKFVHIAHHGDEGEEVQTLSLLHQFCHANPTAKVLYFHDKGSYHSSHLNAKLCAVLDCFVLNPHCIAALDDHDVCGFRLSPTPHLHFPGNFWWARCSYVNTLVDPLIARNNQTYLSLVAPLNPECIPVKGRFFAETWIGTGVVLRPADCLNITYDTSYIWSYELPAVVDQFCPQPGINTGLPCQTAAMYAHPDEFRFMVHARNSYLPQEECRDNRKEVTQRSQIMYGRDPVTYLDWMNKLYAAPPLPNHSVVRFSGDKSVYVMEDGVLHVIPDGRTFMAMGFDFGDVKALQAVERPLYTIGEPIAPR